GDNVRANELYRDAHNAAKHIPALGLNEAGNDVKMDTPYQALEVARYLMDKHKVGGVPKKFDFDLKYLDGTGTTNQTEESVRSLGQYLGFLSTRPDDEFGTGPDDLWLIPNVIALFLELKTGKTT